MCWRGTRGEGNNFFLLRGQEVGEWVGGGKAKPESDDFKPAFELQISNNMNPTKNFALLLQDDRLKQT